MQSQAGKNKVKQLVIILTRSFYGARYESSPYSTELSEKNSKDWDFFPQLKMMLNAIMKLHRFDDTNLFYQKQKIIY
ncbi:MAG: hypothetical protein HC787_03965 [Nostocaceae cyanobacterium CSU_2_110]|nr:hypothetical protein [Nostocaceae cyanobacterium CSU_2_110]